MHIIYKKPGHNSIFDFSALDFIVSAKRIMFTDQTG